MATEPGYASESKGQTVVAFSAVTSVLTASKVSREHMASCELLQKPMKHIEPETEGRATQAT